MAAYPAIGVDYGSSERTIDPLRTARALDNTLKASRVATGPKAAFMVVHDNLSNADKITLRTFYNTNRGVTLTFTWPADGATYTVVLGDGIEWLPLKGGKWRVRVPLEEV